VYYWIEFVWFCKWWYNFSQLWYFCFMHISFSLKISFQFMSFVVVIKIVTLYPCYLSILCKSNKCQKSCYNVCWYDNLFFDDLKIKWLLNENLNMVYNNTQYKSKWNKTKCQNVLHCLAQRFFKEWNIFKLKKRFSLKKI